MTNQTQTRTAKALGQARTPTYNGTTTSGEWSRPSLGDMITAFATDTDQDVSQWGDLSQESRQNIASRSFLGDSSADSYDEGLAFPAVTTNDSLHAEGVRSAIQRAPQSSYSQDTIDSVQRVAQNLLDDEFDGSESVVEGQERFERFVEFKATDPSRRVVYGAALVPNRLDHQGDFFRPDTVRRHSEGFMERLPAGESHGGVMHAVWPDDHMVLVENTILGSPRTVGAGDVDSADGTDANRTFTLPEGAWMQAWRVTDDDLWQLIDGDVLQGYSIGGWVFNYEQYQPGDLPADVDVPTPVQDQLAEHDLSVGDVETYEVTSGLVEEISLVDHPAVPDALHIDRATPDTGGSERATGAMEHERVLAKAADALLDSRASCVEYLSGRGHSRDDAELLADYLQDVAPDPDGAADSDVDDSAATTTATTAMTETPGWIARAKHRLGIGTSTERAQTSDEPADTGALPIEDMDNDELTNRFDTLEAQTSKTNDTLSDIHAALVDGDGNGGGGSEKSTSGDDDPSPTIEDVMERLDSLENAAESGGDTDDTSDPDGPTATELMEQIEQMNDNQQALAEQSKQVAATLSAMAEATGASQQTRGGGGTASTSDKSWADTFNLPAAAAETGGER